MPTNLEHFKEMLAKALDNRYPDWESKNNDLSDDAQKKAIRRWITKGNPLTTPNGLTEFFKRYQFDEVVVQQLWSLYHLAKKDPHTEVVVTRNVKPKLFNEWALEWLWQNRFISMLVVSLVMLSVMTIPQYDFIELNRDWHPRYMTHSEYELSFVPSGCFSMGNTIGDEDEKPMHEQCFSRPFWIGVTEVTNAYYGSPPPEPCNLNQVNPSLGLVNQTSPEYPRNCITWQEANDFCLSKGMRLPTEAEWEYAARGPESWLYPWGNEANSTYAVVRTNFSNNAIPGDMQAVGSKPYDTSWVGAKDMAGSLREFTSTIYNTVTNNGTVKFPYPYNPNDGRESLVNEGTSGDVVNRKETTTLRVVRGGSFDWGIAQSTATTRVDEWYDFLWNDYGFRCALDATNSESNTIPLIWLGLTVLMLISLSFVVWRLISDFRDFQRKNKVKLS